MLLFAININNYASHNNNRKSWHLDNVVILDSTQSVFDGGYIIRAFVVCLLFLQSSTSCWF